MESYKSAGAFRSAIETRLRTASLTKGDAWLQRQRKFLVFDRLLARLLIVAPDRWLLKGAVALDFRLGDRARATIDLDLARQEDELAATEDLQLARVTDIGDYFVFQIQRTSKLDDLIGGTAVRYHVIAELDGRRFERVVLDIGFNQPVLSVPDLLTGSDFLAFAGIPPIQIPALPIDQHVAEKLHAYTRIYHDGRPSSRVKDLIDLVLIAESLELEVQALKRAIDGTFAARGAHEAPRKLPNPPADWDRPYRVLATDTGLDPRMSSGHATAARLLDPVLRAINPAPARWQPESGVWE